MPQLNPNPWFTILILTWFTFSFLIQPKLLSFTPMNSPTNKTKTMKPTPWAWPWT
uniref:ATP synthase complex subunit 8 n=1 Tax=Syrmaticus soemmerringii ijimae TaxID=265498 RepID=B1Q2D3_SYRSO|nr:ATP synthase F0 subunit 8 [Syrmaticus soemmerringii ijimae]BAG16187.1 ATPase subunit 8 [Syrmaticus soemmerringii ijimae]